MYQSSQENFFDKAFSFSHAKHTLDKPLHKHTWTNNCFGPVSLEVVVRLTPSVNWAIWCPPPLDIGVPKTCPPFKVGPLKFCPSLTLY